MLFIMAAMEEDQRGFVENPLVCNDVQSSPDRSYMNDGRKILCFHFKPLTLRKLLMVLGLGQILSLCLCGTSVTSGLLLERNVSIPTAQSFSNYALLSVVYMPWMIFRRSSEYDGVLETLKDRGWKYFLLACVDVEGNYLMVKAYQYTSVTSVQLLDCFVIPVVLVLSYFILKVKYRIVHYVGVFICLFGVGGLVLADVLTLKNMEGVGHGLVGDLMVLGASLLYGISNVMEEFVVKNFNTVEFLAMLGTFGLVVNGIQLALLEREELMNVDFSSYETLLLLAGFALSLFLYYSLVPVLLTISSAAVLNLSNLSADFFAVLAGLFLFKYHFHPLYFVAFILIIIGVIVFCSREPPSTSQQMNDNISQNRNNVNASKGNQSPSCEVNVDDEEESPTNTESDEKSPLRSKRNKEFKFS